MHEAWIGGMCHELNAEWQKVLTWESLTLLQYRLRVQILRPHIHCQTCSIFTCLILLIAIVMASEKKPIDRSKLLTHPLGGGQAGVLRESGLVDNERGMYDAWSRGLTVHRMLNYRTKGASPVEFTNLVYDEILHSAILGLKTIGGGSGPNDKARV